MRYITRIPDFDAIPHGAQFVALKAERMQTAKRRWRGLAEDGADFGFDLEQPLAHGTVFFIENGVAYRLEQLPEPVLVIPYFSARHAAQLAWMVGNLHFLAAFADDGMMVMDDTAVRQMLLREGIIFRQERRVFSPPPRSGHHQHHHEHAH